MTTIAVADTTYGLSANRYRRLRCFNDWPSGFAQVTKLAGRPVNKWSEDIIPLRLWAEVTPKLSSLILLLGGEPGGMAVAVRFARWCEVRAGSHPEDLTQCAHAAAYAWSAFHAADTRANALRMSHRYLDASALRSGFLDIRDRLAERVGDLPDYFVAWTDTFVAAARGAILVDPAVAA